MLFVRIEVMDRKAESVETKLENRIQRLEDDMQAKVQRTVQAMLHSTVIPVYRKSSERNGRIFGEYCLRRSVTLQSHVAR